MPMEDCYKMLPEERFNFIHKMALVCDTIADKPCPSVCLQSHDSHQNKVPCLFCVSPSYVTNYYCVPGFILFFLLTLSYINLKKNI